MTNPTNSPTTASGDDTVSSSTQTATTNSLRNSNNESTPTIFGELHNTRYAEQSDDLDQTCDKLGETYP